MQEWRQRERASASNKRRDKKKREGMSLRLFLRRYRENPAPRRGVSRGPEQMRWSKGLRPPLEALRSHGRSRLSELGMAVAGEGSALSAALAVKPKRR